MSFYRFTIRDYHSVEEADIRIDGITVLAGINSSGKSTDILPLQMRLNVSWIEYHARKNT